jgi:sec-independent protein translocase protein TatB
MFGFSWGEIGIIMAVALIAIGPKDLPVAIRTVTGLIKKARGLAAEFQGHVDEMMREANVTDVVSDLKKATSVTRTLPAELAKTLGGDGLLNASIKDMDALMAKAMTSTNTTSAVPPEVVEDQVPGAPAFIPPEAARKAPVPAFIPPGTKRWGF